MEVWKSKYPQVVTSFDHIFTSSEIGLRKPEHAPFEYIARTLNLSPDAILFFDDLLENVGGAKAAGLNAVHVTAPSNVRDALKALGCGV